MRSFKALKSDAITGRAVAGYFIRAKQLVALNPHTDDCLIKGD